MLILFYGGIVHRKLPPVLTYEESVSSSLTRFREQTVDAGPLEKFLRDGWQPNDVRDFGEIPHFFRYFAEQDTTAEISIDPCLNDHHANDGPHRVKLVAFCLGRSSALFQHARRLPLGEVDPEVMEAVFGGLCRLFARKGRHEA